MVDLELKFPEGFFDEEVRDGTTVTKKRKEIWAVELDLLNKLQKVCDEHNLKFFLDSGSLLGAVRSSGMIPWDNDIDVVMLRKDYDLLIHEYSSYFDYPYFLQSFYSDKEYYRGHAQLRNSATTGLVIPEKDIVSYNQGIFLDIFPLDAIPDDNDLAEKLKGKLEKQYHILRQEQSPKWPTNSKFKKLLRIERTCLLRRIFGDENTEYQSIENELRNNNDWEFIDKIFFRITLKENWKKIKRSDYADTIYKEFEFLRCPIPKGYDRILKVLYGPTYMIPQKEPNMHDAKGTIFDADKPYSFYKKQ